MSSIYSKLMSWNQSTAAASAPCTNRGTASGDKENISAATSKPRELNSQSLYWEDLNKPKFLGLITAFYLGIRIALYPTTIVKTRQQTSAKAPHAAATPAPGKPQSLQNVQYRNVAHAFSSLYRLGGIRALYQGFRFNIIGLAVDPIYFSSLEYSRSEIQHYFDSRQWNHSSKLKELAVTLSAGGAAAVVQQTFMVPIDVVTQNIMIKPTVPKASAIAAGEPPVERTSTRSIIRSIYAADGIRGFYKGYVLTLSAVVPFSALQWALYWQIQSAFSHYLHAHPSKSAPAISTHKTTSDSRELYTAPISAGIASALASLATQPMDTLKTRLQVQSKRTSLSETLKTLVADKGIKGFMSGSLARILTLAPSAVLSMSAYEAIKRNSVREDLL